MTNFKSIKELKGLKLKPLTLLTGINSSGKSNIMEAMAFFGQAARIQEVQPSTRPSLIQVLMHGDIKRYPQEIGSFVVYRKKNEPVSLEIHIKPTKSLLEDIRILLDQEQESRDLPSKADPGKPIQKIFPKGIKTKIKSVGYSFRFHRSDTYRQNVFINKKTLMSVFLAPLAGIQQSRVLYPKDFLSLTMRESPENLLSAGVFIPTDSAPNLKLVSEMAVMVLTFIRDHAKKVYLISGERGRIDPGTRSSERRLPIPSWVGSNGQDVVEILSHCMTRETEKARKIQEWAERFQLPGVTAGRVLEGTLESNYKDRILDIDLNTSLAGLGSRQILTIITQIFWSGPDSVIMIEEPETSLHPQNQVLLHELFAEAVSEKKQIICSTHSPFFILALSRIIKKKLLTLDQIAVYHVEKDKEGTHVKELRLNEHGFVASGVPTFMKAEEELFRDWSESLEEE
ncbi:ATP-binding protein [Candidatus Bathyarchaeota archaeon]|nr:ATP-binding protein [Candidatus Bathyarchaeota archaeon]